jgi:hypothetical protein
MGLHDVLFYHLSVKADFCALDGAVRPVLKDVMRTPLAREQAPEGHIIDNYERDCSGRFDDRTGRLR